MKTLGRYLFTPFGFIIVIFFIVFVLVPAELPDWGDQRKARAEF